MLLQNVILSFPNLFKPSIPKGSQVARFDAQFLIAPNHPQLGEVQSLFNAAAAAYPGAVVPPGTDVCFSRYEERIPSNKDYYRPDLVGWYILQCTRKEDQGKPATVDAGYNDVIDPSQFFSGSLVHVNCDISHYAAGKGGIGGWLNGVMTTGQEGQLGRLDGRPTVEQMFSGIGQTAPVTAPGMPAPPAAPGMPAPPAAPGMPAPPAAPAAPVRQMTPAAGAFTYEQYIASGHTDETLIRDGLMLPPGGVAPSFM